MPIPYRFYSEIQKESTVWEVESRCKRYNFCIMQITGPYQSQSKLPLEVVAVTKIDDVKVVHIDANGNITVEQQKGSNNERETF